MKSRFLRTLLLAVFVAAFCVNAVAKDFVLVIDAGHGGKDVGAVGDYAMEKDVNLGVALKFGELVKKHCKNVKVVYTRHADFFVSLQDRANIANKAKGDLFVSIHTNSVDKKSPSRYTVTGSETYTLGLHRSNENLEVAKRENSVIELEDDYSAKYQGFDPNSAESYIIFEFNQKVTPEVVHSSTQVTTAGVSRQVTNSYVSDDQGHVVYYDNSKYVTLELSLQSYNRYNMGGNADPMYFYLSTWSNHWLESYMVSMKDLSVVAEGSSQSQMVSSEQDAINNRLMPTTEVFDERGQVGNMQYAAYSAQTGTGNSTKPLIVWLHGIGERGTDMNIPLLSNDVYALTQPEIQGHFLTTGDQARGVNVLAVQTQTPWGSDNAAQL